MKEREVFPAPPSPDDPQGGLTGATGNLSPDDPDGEFVPAETREMTGDAGERSAGTSTAHQRAVERRAAEPDDPGSLLERGERTAPNDRDGGYGSQHGLATDDPAYREELNEPGTTGQAGPATPSDFELGGDERGEADDHF